MISTYEVLLERVTSKVEKKLRLSKDMINFLPALRDEIVQLLQIEPGLCRAGIIDSSGLVIDPVCEPNQKSLAFVVQVDFPGQDGRMDFQWNVPFLVTANGGRYDVQLSKDRWSIDYLPVIDTKQLRVLAEASIHHLETAVDDFVK